MNFITVIVIIANIILCIVVLSRNVKNKLHRALFVFGLSTTAWTLFNFLVDLGSGFGLFYLRMVYFASMLMAIAGLTLSRSFDTSAFTLKNNSIVIRLTYGFFAFCAVIAISPFMVTGTKTTGTGVIAPVLNRNLYYVFLIGVIISFWGAIINYFLSLKKASSVQRKQILSVGYGVIIFGITALFINVILPATSQNWQASQYGPFTTLLFLLFITYAVIRHKFLYIRPVVFRAVLYGFVIIFFAIVNGILFYLGTRIHLEKGLTLGSRFEFLFPLVLISAISFHPIKSFFDKLTREVFYRDMYDSQVILDTLSDTLVRDNLPDSILSESASLLQGVLKPTSGTFLILINNKLENRLTFGHSQKVDSRNQQWDEVVKQLQKNKKQVVTEDDFYGDDRALSIFDANGVSVLSKMETDKEIVGYLVLGPKISGGYYTDQDISLVNTATNELAIALQNALRFEEIQQFNITLQQKIDDATHQLRKANDKLRALDETKDEFISMASHQLRTPLTSVKGYVSMVLEGDAGKVTSPQKKLLDQAFMSSQRMVYLIADLLNVSRLRTGKFVIDAQPTNLADLVEGEINQLTETAKGRGLELIFVKPKDFPTLMLDETKTRQVIMNFADNAIYYTPSGGHISVNLVETPESVELTVVDNGLGVPKHDQHHMFTKFFRAGNAKKARPDGTGLGLFMAKKVVIAQGGAIIFRSEEGKGSTFGFSFPKTKLKVQGVSEKAG